MGENSKYKVKVSSKGQVVIPGEVRNMYGFTKGTELIVTVLDENRLLLERVPRLSDFFGFLGDVKASEILLMEREREIRAEKERREELGK